MDKKEIMKKFIASCTITFKAFEYSCDLAKSSASIWNFVATNQSGEKVYAVYCAPKLDKAHSLIRLAKKKLKPNMKLVVVTESHTEEELENSRGEGYALVSLGVLNKFGEEMIHVRAREAEQATQTRERLF